MVALHSQVGRGSWPRQQKVERLNAHGDFNQGEGFPAKLRWELVIFLVAIGPLLAVAA